VRNKWVIFIVMGLFLFSTLACNLSELTTLVNERAGTAQPAAPATVVVEVTPTPAAAAPAASAPQVDVEEQRFIDVYARVSPAVVCVTADQQFGECIGSGFIIDTEGHVVTNNHVATATDNLLVTLADEHSVPATVVGTDPGSDLAVLKIDAPAEELTVAELGESASLKVGQRAIAIGNPFGLERTMTTGIISSLGRTLARTDSNFQIAEVIQTDAAINPGNSGGPLLDTQGKVIGINSAIFSTSGTSSGVGFAIPVDIIKRVAPELIASGHYRHTWLGVSGQTITPELVDALDLPADNGVLIFSVEPNSPSEQAGLLGGSQPATVSGVNVMAGGDIITAINDVPVKRFEDVVNYLASYTSVGDVVTLTILRDGQQMTVDVTLQERPANQ
jgi:S1-C subfamily serine protease